MLYNPTAVSLSKWAMGVSRAGFSSVSEIKYFPTIVKFQATDIPSYKTLPIEKTARVKSTTTLG